MGGRNSGADFERQSVANTLLTVGFTEFEVKQFVWAKTPNGQWQPLPNLKDPAWKEVMYRRVEERGAVIKELKRGGAKRVPSKLIDRVFDVRYKVSKKASPWEFIQAESLKGTKKRNTIDYSQTARAIRQARSAKAIEIAQKQRVRKARQLAMAA